MTTPGFKEYRSGAKISPEPPHSRSRPVRHRPPIVQLRHKYENLFSHWEVIFLSSIVNSTYMVQGNVCRTFYCTYDELSGEYGDDLIRLMIARAAIQEWYHADGFIAVTLTPWCASVLGVRLAEYLVRQVKRIYEYRGLNRNPARVRVLQWDTAQYWTYVNRPDKPVRIPANPCELPLIGDPEDKRHQGEYTEDWQTFSFTKTPHKAITIRV